LFPAKMNISDAETTNVKASNTEILKIVLRDCTFILPPFFVLVIYYKIITKQI